MSIVLVKNNRKPDLEFTLKKRGVAVDLTGATVAFKLRKPSGAIVVKAASVATPANGRIVIAWGAGDLDEQGECLGEVAITFAGGLVQNSKYAIEIYVRDEYEEV